MYNSRNTVHHDFKGNGDLLLDLFGGDSRPLRDDIDVIIGHVRIRLNRKAVERYDASGKKQEGEGQHDGPMVQGKINNAANHSLLHSSLHVQAIRYHLIAVFYS